MKNCNILVSGSVGIDMIFSVQGTIREKIHFKKNGKLSTQNLMFHADAKQERFGGTGANIAYGLGKLGAKPMLFSLVGRDFKINFAPHLKKMGVDIRVGVDKIGYTSHFYGITDKKKEQIGIWQPNAYEKIHKLSLTKTISKKELKNTRIAIFSAGTKDSIYAHLTQFRKFAPSATVIFDPGQELAHFDVKALKECINLSNLIIVNEVEYYIASRILKEDFSKFLLEKNKILIKTKGEKGSLIFERGKKIIKVKAIKPKVFVDPTGAGDAYRAGVVFGLYSGKNLALACVTGSRLASKCIEHLGGQEY